jgi:phospholipid/cholesterol/gamma-HCH transport system substrate-binding protein
MKLDVENTARVAFAIVLLLGAAAGAGWYLLSSSRYVTYEMRTHDSVSGLIVDAPVEYHGIDVGRVKRVELLDPRSVRILVNIERDAPVTTATVATITTRGLAARGFTGYVYVSLEDTGSESRRLVSHPGQRYPVIALTSPRSASLDTAISRMDENMLRIIERMDDVLDAKTVAALKGSVDNLQRVTKTLADNNAKLNALIVTGERASRELQPLLKSSNETVDALQRQILPETHKALTNLDSLSRQLQPLVASSDRTLSILQTQILPEAHKTLTDLDDLSTSLTSFANKVDKDPSVIVRGVIPQLFGLSEGQREGTRDGQ